MNTYNFISKCQPSNRCEANIFCFDLPSGNGLERNQYLAFILPCSKQEKYGPSCHPSPKPCLSCDHRKKTAIMPETKVRSDTTVTAPIRSSCGWDTEYRSTIDECARRMMCMDPIFPRNIKRAPKDVETHVQKVLNQYRDERKPRTAVNVKQASESIEIDNCRIGNEKHVQELKAVCKPVDEFIEPTSNWSMCPCYPGEEKINVQNNLVRNVRSSNCQENEVFQLMQKCMAENFTRVM